MVADGISRSDNIHRRTRRRWEKCILWLVHQRQVKKGPFQKRLRKQIRSFRSHLLGYNRPDRARGRTQKEAKKCLPLTGRAAVRNLIRCSKISTGICPCTSQKRLLLVERMRWRNRQAQLSPLKRNGTMHSLYTPWCSYTTAQRTHWTANADSCHLVKPAA